MKKGKVLAIDYGTKRIGVASGDLEVKIAFPRTVIENKGMDFVMKELLKICDELDVKIIVVGLPLSMEEGQKENKIMQGVKIFVKKLKSILKNVEIVLFDERLSSFEAEELMQKYNLTGPDDLYAAQIILQRFFHGPACR